MSRKPSSFVREHPAWFDGQGPEGEVIVSTRVRLARNLAGHHFPPVASPRERTAVYEKVVGAMEDFRSFTIANFSVLPLLRQQLFVEKRIASADLLHGKGDRGIGLDRFNRVNVLINEEDHLRLQCLDSGCRPFESWKSVDAVDEQLGRKLDFAYDKRKGFLTSCPTNSGTGLRVSFLMHLPGLVLTRSVDAVLQGASQMGIGIRGFFGENSAVVGNFFQLSNQATLGAQEQEFINDAHRVVAEVARYERDARQRLLKEARLEVTDRIYRAYGILQQARTLSIAEFLNLASALRLGCDCGLFNGIDIPDLNRATLLIMPAHLQLSAKKVMNEVECGVARAGLVHRFLIKKRKKRAS